MWAIVIVGVVIAIYLVFAQGEQKSPFFVNLFFISILG
jgi:hypothetical protein